MEFRNFLSIVVIVVAISGSSYAACKMRIELTKPPEVVARPDVLKDIKVKTSQFNDTSIKVEFSGTAAKDITEDMLKGEVSVKLGPMPAIKASRDISQDFSGDEMIMPEVLRCSNLGRDLPVKAGQYKGTSCIANLEKLQHLLGSKTLATIAVKDDTGKEYLKVTLDLVKKKC